MKAVIKGQEVEIPVTTVSIAPAELDDMLMFHCIECGETITQYQGFVTKIYPYLEPSPEALVLKRCRKCHKQYRFLTHKGTLPKKVKVILIHNGMGINEFHCFFDRFIVARYSQTSIFTVVDNVPKATPATVFCPSKICNVEYLFSDIV